MLQINLNSTPPDKEAWGEIDNTDLDLVYSYKNYLGKTNQEVIDRASRFIIIEYVDEIRWMPQKPFIYYVQGLSFYISTMNYDKFDASMHSDCYLSLIDKKIRKHPDWFENIFQTIDECFEVILKNSNFFNDETNEIYPWVEPRIFEIRKFWKNKK